jgi:hypothetical protein
MRNVIVVIAILIFIYAFDNTDSHCPETGVKFLTTDSTLQKLYNKAEEMAFGNIKDYGDRKVLIEGAQYRSVWLETQPMGGYMFAKRDLEIARNNVEIFMDYQRADGRLPGVIYIKEGIVDPNYCQLQGFCFPMPAWELYFLLDRDTTFLKRVYLALKKYDTYLWRTRDSDHNGCLETWCIYDTGEDNSIRFNGFPNSWSFDYPPSKEIASQLSSEELRTHCKEDTFDSSVNMTVPIESMDVMSWSYSCRHVLSLISVELDNGKEDYWSAKAEEVKSKTRSYLWDEEKHACYDRDRENCTMPVLLHNNLRCMYFGSFDQDMADSFVKYHLMNPEEFWTQLPLPSIAANDLSFRNMKGNNWSGQTQALTFQRSIRALENYGHYAELTMIGQKFLKAIADSLRFSQQFDPFTAATTGSQDGYGPSVLTALEFISRFYGIHITQDKIWWSCLSSDHEYEYTQKWNDRVFYLKTKGENVFCSVDGRQVLCFTKGARLITDLSGELIEIAGITGDSKTINIKHPYHHSLLVEPNKIYRFGCDGKPGM